MTAKTQERLTRTRLGGKLDVSLIGLGCMGMAEFYGDPDEAESIRTIHGALDRGMDFLDTADMYGAGRSEEIVGKALQGDRRDQVTLATKCGLIRTPEGVRVDCSPRHIAEAIDASLRRLRTDRVDLYYLHRIDPNVPVEESVGAMADLVKVGKVRHLGLSEAGSESIRRGHAVHPLTAVQSEYSLASRNPERRVLPAVRELGIGFVAWGPMSRGLLAGEITSDSELGPKDMRRGLPRFTGTNLSHNIDLVRRLGALAAEQGCSLAQLALAWLTGQGVVPIPGAQTREHMAENASAATITFSRETLSAISEIAKPGAFAGERFPEHLASMVEEN